MIKDITPVVLTYNEEKNIQRTLDALQWAQRIVVVDSGSNDNTLNILRQYQNVTIVTRRFDTHAQQWNHGLSNVQTEWVLALDADYQLSDQLVQELRDLTPAGDIGGYRIRFVYTVFGRPLRATLYPPRISLFRRSQARYIDEGHTQKISIESPVMELRHVIFHDDRKSLARWLDSQIKYARLEADYIAASAKRNLSRVDRLRALGCLAPIIMPWYLLFARGLILDGPAGLYYTFQRTLAECMLTIEILDRKVRVVSKSPREI